MTDTDRKLAEEILQKHLEILNGTTMRTRIVDAMDEYFAERLKSLAPTDEEIKQLENEYYYSERALDEKCTWRHGFDDAMSIVREKLTGKSEEKQKAQDKLCETCAYVCSGPNDRPCGECEDYNKWSQKGAPFDEEIK